MEHDLRVQREQFEAHKSSKARGDATTTRPDHINPGLAQDLLSEFSTGLLASYIAPRERAA
eukprot:5740291-Pleurochrysis_carterae.AAC.1